MRHAKGSNVGTGSLPDKDKKESSGGKCTIRRQGANMHNDTYVHAVMMYYGHPKITTTPPENPPTVWPASSNWFSAMNYYNAADTNPPVNRTGGFDTRYEYITLEDVKHDSKNEWWHWQGPSNSGVDRSLKGWPFVKKYEPILNGEFAGHLKFPKEAPDWPKLTPPWKTKWVTINYVRYRISVEKFGKSDGNFVSGTDSIDLAACPGPNKLLCAQKTPDGPFESWPGCGAIVKTDKKTALLRNDTAGTVAVFDDIQTSFENTSKLHTSFVEKVIKGTDEIVNNLDILSSTDKEILAAHFGIESGITTRADTLREGLLTKERTLSELIDANSGFADAVPVYFEDGVVSEKLDKLTNLQYAASTELSKITAEEKTNNTAITEAVAWRAAGGVSQTRCTKIVRGPWGQQILQIPCPPGTTGIPDGFRKF